MATRHRTPPPHLIRPLVYIGIGLLVWVMSIRFIVTEVNWQDVNWQAIIGAGILLKVLGGR